MLNLSVNFFFQFREENGLFFEKTRGRFQKWYTFLP